MSFLFHMYTMMSTGHVSFYLKEGEDDQPVWCHMTDSGNFIRKNIFKG